MGGPLRVGVVGAGTISAQYSVTVARLPQLAVTAVADLDAGRAEQLAGRHAGARATTLESLVASDDVDVVLNLTIPAAHSEVALAALVAGKHVYGEKPLATTVDEGRSVLAAAAGRRVACAPDTVLGTGTQTARAALDSGAIGVPHAATAFMTTPGHELWHPDPAFYYRPGGGPLLDMGPYYLTALVHLLGPVRRVLGATSRPRSRRTVATGPKAGEQVDVEVDTHVTGILEHEGGALTTLLLSFDTWAGHLPRIEVYGDAGSLAVPDPNHFDGPVELFDPTSRDWRTLGPTAGFVDAGRGVGLADLAISLEDDRPHRSGADVALHVLDVMESLLAAADSGSAITLTTTCVRPQPVSVLLDLSGAR